MRLALMPLDERPVNTRLAVDVGAVAGVEVTVPPPALLPSVRVPGNTEDLADWLIGIATETSTAAAIVSIDMLVHGGLIASRTGSGATTDVLARTQTLHDIRKTRPGLPVSAVSIVTRASDSYSTDEEPPYWGEFGRELHRLGADLHRRYLADLGAEQPASSSTGGQAAGVDVPLPMRADFGSRRLRNHIVNLAALGLSAEGVVDPLLITADDTAVRSAGSVEQGWLNHWRRALPTPGTVLMHPGADEVGAVLVARALGVLHEDDVTFAVECGEAGGLARVAPYENLPVGHGAVGQVHAAGGVIADDHRRPDAIIVLHAPDISGGDWCGNPPIAASPDPAASTVAAVRRALDTGAAVGLADVRYPNGADPTLVEMLLAENLLLELAAYGGWNTAGNSIGSVVATLKASVVGRRAGAFNSDRARRLLLHRLVDDWAYQAVVRTQLVSERGIGFGMGGLASESLGAYVRDVRVRLQAELDRLTGRSDAVNGLTLPWGRVFEIDFELTRPPRAPHHAPGDDCAIGH